MNVKAHRSIRFWMGNLLRVDDTLGDNQRQACIGLTLGIPSLNRGEQGEYRNYKKV